MLNYKLLFCFTAIAACLISCLGPRQSFNASAHLSDTLWGGPERLSSLMGGATKVTEIKSVLVFKCALKEIMVERKNVTDFTLVNTSSEIKDVGLAVSRYSQEMYLIVFKVLRKKEGQPTWLDTISRHIAIFLSASFNKPDSAKLICTGIGPAYIGELAGDPGKRVSNSVFKITNSLKVIKHGEHFVFAKKTGRSKAEDIVFFSDVSLLPDASDISAFKNYSFDVYKIIQGIGNKISGGNKRLVFNVEDIFGDEKALSFRYYKTFSDSSSHLWLKP